VIGGEGIGVAALRGRGEGQRAGGRQWEVTAHAPNSALTDGRLCSGPLGNMLPTSLAGIGPTTDFQSESRQELLQFSREFGT